MEVAKVGVAALTPILVLALGVLVNRAARRIEHAQWANRKLIERRLDVFDAMAEPLNDLLCFFRLVGDFKKISPPVAIARKRQLDRIFHVHEPLMSAQFVTHYHAFMSACFLTYTGIGEDAKLRAGEQRQRTERGPDWQNEWSHDFAGGTPSGLSEITGLYRALMDSFATDLGVNRVNSSKEPVLR